jgi:two-component system LytT family response regulator
MHTAKEVSKNRIHLRTHLGHISIDPDEIMYCKAEGCYTRITTHNCREILVSKPLKTFMKFIPNVGFLRCHYSFLLNISWVKSFDSRNKTVLVKENFLPVSRRNATEVFTILSLSGIPDVHSKTKI